LHYFDKKEMSTIGCSQSRCGLQFMLYVLFVFILEFSEEKRLCGGVLIVKCHPACQSASNCTTQS